MEVKRVLELIHQVRQKLNNTDIPLTVKESCSAQNTLYELERSIIAEGESTGEIPVSYETCNGPCWPAYPSEILKTIDEWNYGE